MENLRKIREKRHKSQINLAIEVGVTQEAISSYENGYSFPKLSVLVKIANYLETSTDYLLGLTDDDTAIKYITNKLNKKERELLEVYTYLSTENQLKVLGYIDALKEK